MAGLYIHIPFCQSRCIYCDFYSTTLPVSWQMPYIEALGRELELRVTNYDLREKDSKLGTRNSELKTLYIGGGTPSQLTSEALRRLFYIIDQHITLAPDAEVTIEANPDDVCPQWISLLKDTPVNRISMGVQSLDDGILRTLHRRHTARQAKEAIEKLQEAGYQNLSNDLIYGLPGQSLSQFESDVREMLAMGIPHLSAYALQFEEGTPLMQMKAKGEVTEADEELSLACYNKLIDLTHDAGLEHYEISNFARPGWRSRHNSSYWTGTPYLGLGAGAHSYDGKRQRSYNCEDLKRYIQEIEQGQLPMQIEELDEDARYNERVMLSLRTCEGLSLSALEQDFGRERLNYCLRMAKPHIEGGRLQEKADKSLCLTRHGLFVSDDIISDLMV